MNCLSIFSRKPNLTKRFFNIGPKVMIDKLMAYDDNIRDEKLKEQRGKLYF
jgi:hypothetical protein